MSVSFHTLSVTSGHPLGVFQVGGLVATTVTVAAGSDVYYGEQDLNADMHAGVLEEGQSKTFTVPTWLLSRHSSQVEVEDFSPSHEVEQLKVGKDGRVKSAVKRKAAIVGVTTGKPKRKRSKPERDARREAKAQKRTAEPVAEKAPPEHHKERSREHHREDRGLNEVLEQAEKGREHQAKRVEIKGTLQEKK